MTFMKSRNSPIVVERYSWLERAVHTTHVLAMFILLITGFKIYLGWDFMSFHNARALHMVVVPIFLVLNWILVPYNIFAAGSGFMGKIEHFIDNYVFGPADAKRLMGMVLNFFGKGKYPAFTVFDAKEGHYKTKLHPLMKIIVVIEGLAIVLIALSGVVIYNLQWSLLGLPVASWVISAAGMIAPAFDMSALELVRATHLLMTYWFVFELVIHVGILEFDPKVWKYYKAIFVSGKEDLSDGHYVQVLNK